MCVKRENKCPAPHAHTDEHNDVTSPGWYLEVKYETSFAMQISIRDVTIYASYSWKIDIIILFEIYTYSG